MKIRIDIDGDLEEDEIIIKCRSVDSSIQKIQQYVLEQSTQLAKIAFFKDNEEFYFAVDNVLFFETSSGKVYAHTTDDVFSIKYRLYELEEMLPKHFVRISKSAILNIRHIYSIQRNFASASLVQFQGSHQQVYVSRSYFQNLKQRLDERSLYEK